MIMAPPSPVSFPIHTRTRFELEQLSTELFALLDIKEEIQKQNVSIESFRIAHYVGFNLQEEFELLRHPRETTRQKIILEHIRKILPVVKQMAQIKEKAKLNGHFRLVNPQEGI